MTEEKAVRLAEEALDEFARLVFERLGVPPETARLAVRSLLDASLMGIDTHGIEALDMYVEHLRHGGLEPGPDPVIVRERGGLGLWDMQSGFGLAGARKIMAHAVERAKVHGVYLATCRRSNHIGACGVYGKIAADEGLVARIGQQTGAAFAPWGGCAARIGASPMAFVAPVAGLFPFYYDASFAQMTRGRIKAHIRSNTPLPEDVATDADGRPTTDPRAAWEGQILPIGRHKGIGLAMVNEVLHAVLSGNVFADRIPSIVSHPERSADSSLYMLVLDPEGIMPRAEFARRMREYVEYVESSPPRDPADPPRYPGRREGETWADRREKGIPVSAEGLRRFDEIADRADLRRPRR